MTKLFLLNFIILFGFFQVKSQTVETVASHSKIVDGLYVDPSGNVYTSSGGLVNGIEIGQYNIQTEIYNPYFATGFSGPINIAGYQDSLLIVSNFDNSTVSSYNLNTSAVEVIATGLDGSAGIAIDENDNIYVTNFGVDPTFTGHTIQKITPDGASYIYIDTSALLRPQAICINHENDIIVHSNQKLYKINPVDSTLYEWVNLGFEVGNMTFRYKDSCIYAGAGGNKQQIIKITAQGIASTFAGSIQGYQDGPIASAKFHNPLGVAFSPDEDILYVSEAGGANRLRRILMDNPSSFGSVVKSSIKIFPNPTAEKINIFQEDNEILQVEIYDFYGRLITSKTDDANTISINISQFSKGLYFVKIISNDSIISRSIVKE